MDVCNFEECLDLIYFIEENSNIFQRELAKELGLSLGKVNYFLISLIEIGYIKVKNFQNS